MTGDSDRLISKLVVLYLHLSLSLTCIFFSGCSNKRGWQSEGRASWPMECWWWEEDLSLMLSHCAATCSCSRMPLWPEHPNWRGIKAGVLCSTSVVTELCILVSCCSQISFIGNIALIFEVLISNCLIITELVKFFWWKYFSSNEITGEDQEEYN